ncbi:MAG TPA: fumarylacetoacetase [Candidatus Didemnitutus sp.]|nr:fumarylacetoacetase [Candidatus Didemnitutus sp.]
MNFVPNPTHDPIRLSWVRSANAENADFPLQNLPYGVFSTAAQPTPRVGVAIGDQILDLYAAASADLLPSNAADACAQTSLNLLMAAGPSVWTELRARLSELLGDDTCPPGARRSIVEQCLVPISGVTMRLPAHIGDYTDFYASIHHATNVGAMLRPENPLLPNYKWVPIGYHGRSSSIVASGTPVRRPHGQTKAPDATAPAFGPCRHLDYEAELGAFVGPGNAPGEPIPLAQASRHLFGVVLLNDWSARDIQTWEYQPLGPFLAKNFATTISPWVVTMEALAPFRVSAVSRPATDPSPLPYLSDANEAQHGGIDLTLEVWLITEKMRAAGGAPQRLSRGNFREMYWTLAQLLTHHTSNGCNLRPGDLLGSGTVSGPTQEARGCLLELTRRGTEPIALPNGEERGFLADGDEIILRGYAERPGARRIGLGECRGVVQSAL